MLDTAVPRHRVARNRLGPGGALTLFASLGAHPALVQVVASDNGICTEKHGKGAEASAKLVDAAVHAVSAALRRTISCRQSSRTFRVNESELF